MGYHVKVEELHTALQTIRGQIEQWKSQIKQAQSALQTAQVSSAIKGNTGDNIRSYIAQVQSPLADALQQMLDEFEMKITLYIQGYAELDDSQSAVLLSERLEHQQQLLQQELAQFQTLSGEFNGILASVSDIVPVNYPHTSELEQSFTQLGTFSKEVNTQIGEYEESHKEDSQTTENMIGTIQSIINSRSEIGINASSYVSGSYAMNPAYGALKGQMDVSEEYTKGNKKAYLRALENEYISLGAQTSKEKNSKELEDLLDSLYSAGEVIPDLAGAIKTIKLARESKCEIVRVGDYIRIKGSPGRRNAIEGMKNVKGTNYKIGSKAYLQTMRDGMDKYIPKGDRTITNVLSKTGKNLWNTEAIKNIRNIKNIKSVKNLKDIPKVAKTKIVKFGGEAFGFTKDKKIWGNAGTALAYGSMIFDVGEGIYSNYKNGETKGTKYAADIAIDTAAGFGEMAVATGCAKIGAAIGTAIPIPVVGTVVGAVAGFALGWAGAKLFESVITEDVKKAASKGLEKILDSAGEKLDKAKDAVGGLFGGVGEALAAW